MLTKSGEKWESEKDELLLPLHSATLLQQQLSNVHVFAIVDTIHVHAANIACSFSRSLHFRYIVFSQTSTCSSYHQMFTDVILIACGSSSLGRACVVVALATQFSHSNHMVWYECTLCCGHCSWSIHSDLTWNSRLFSTCMTSNSNWIPYLFLFYLAHTHQIDQFS